MNTNKTIEIEITEEQYNDLVSIAEEYSRITGIKIIDIPTLINCIIDNYINERRI